MPRFQAFHFFFYECTINGAIPTRLGNLIIAPHLLPSVLFAASSLDYMIARTLIRILDPLKEPGIDIPSEIISYLFLIFDNAATMDMFLDFVIVVSYPVEASFMRAVCLYGAEIEAGEWTVLLELSRLTNSDSVGSIIHIPNCLSCSSTVL